MNDGRHVRTYRLAPLWACIVMTLPIGAGTCSILRDWGYDALAGGPLFAIFWYALLAGYLNRTRVQVSWEGVQAECGPIPVMPRPERVHFSEIRRVYVRQAFMPTKSRAIPYLAAGVERTDGRWMDLSEPLISEERVWAEARDIARALSWSRPIEELSGRPKKMDWMAGRFLLYWVGAAMAAFTWGAYVEFALRGS